MYCRIDYTLLYLKLWTLLTFKESDTLQALKSFGILEEKVKSHCWCNVLILDFKWNRKAGGGGKTTFLISAPSTDELNDY